MDAQLRKIREWDEWACISCLVSAQLHAFTTIGTRKHCDLTRGTSRTCQAVPMSDLPRTEGQFPSPSRGLDCLDCSEDECAFYLLITLPELLSSLLPLQ